VSDSERLLNVTVSDSERLLNVTVSDSERLLNVRGDRPELSRRVTARNGERSGPHARAVAGERLGGSCTIPTDTELSDYDTETGWFRLSSI